MLLILNRTSSDYLRSFYAYSLLYKNKLYSDFNTEYGMNYLEMFYVDIAQYRT